MWFSLTPHSSLSLTPSAISSHALSLLSSSHLFLVLVVIAVAASLREFFLSACHHCISSHLLPFLCEMSSCGEMAEAIELRWVKARVGGVNSVFVCVQELADDIQLLYVYSLYVCLCAHLYVFLHVCVCLILHLSVFWFLTGSTVTVVISTLGYFSQPHLFFCPSIWPCFNKAEICKLYGGQQEIYVCSWQW